ncbi:MAG: CHRD domain-containing protein [Candidatus Eisenbacteria bacterium]|uniref:CHRD domain-containing protein n=1 Tax=Eiseniibacteriota bacterium TaxID=2212470 RepID=A0A538T6W1_UNCEI|nr:MAG: CHRD domain-containing protein [Candidatus Eisenbacteria bacterium]
MTRIRQLSFAVATLFLVGAPLSAQAASKVFTAHLTGDQVVPARQTNANGQAHFTLNQDETQLEFRLTVSNIENVIGANLYVGAPGENGTIVATIFGPVAPGGGKTTGVLAKGTITAANLVGSLAGRPMSDLTSAIRAGNTYVSVLTDDGQGASDQKPGDFASGEIRGQIR